MDNESRKVSKGFLRNVLCSKISSSYVNENEKLGLKHRSLLHFGYKQVEYNEVTRVVGERPYPGGRVCGMKTVELEPAVFEERPVPGSLDGATEMVVVKKALTEEREILSYKMNELPAEHVFDYGCDDTICTAALHNYCKLIMELEGTYEIYKEVEIPAAYLHALNFVRGVSFSVSKSKKLERHDDKVFDTAWGVVREYLISKGWEGTVPPEYTDGISVAQVKEAYAIVHPDKEFPSTKRKMDKLVADLNTNGDVVFAAMLAKCVEGYEGAVAFTTWVQSHFTGEPVFNTGSPKQMAHLLYDVMGLPIEVRNKPTDAMKVKGEKGNPKTDALAQAYCRRAARRQGRTDIDKVIESLTLMKMVETRRGLYYHAYPYLVHWKTGKLHPTHNQCGTNTRRASASRPNTQQLPKHPKIEGHEARFRETIVPHKKGAVVVSMDFAAQELRVIADYSQDPNMLACYIGDSKKDMHSFIAVGIVQKRFRDKATWTYEEFMRHLKDPESPEHKFCKEMRALGKKVGFTTEYGAMAPKLAMTLLVSEEEAQEFIDAKEEVFSVAAAWKRSVIEEAKALGFVTTKLGARRHLREALQGDDFSEASKAERQAVNFKIQGSSAEMTKLAEGRMWNTGLFLDYDAICYGPVHDEIFCSVMVDERFVEFLQKMHRCMVAPYADMTVPIESSISFGPDFYNQTEIGDQPTADAIKAGLDVIAKSKSNPEKETA